MNRSSFRTGRERKGKARLVLLILAVLAVLGAFLVLRAGPDPKIDLQTDMPAIGPSTPISVIVSEPSRGLASVRVEVVQGETTHELENATFPERPFWRFWEQTTESFEADYAVGSESIPGLGLEDVRLRISAEGQGAGLRGSSGLVFEMPVDLRAPELVSLVDQPVVRQGGSGAIVYRVGADAVSHGVRVGEHTFPGRPLPVAAAESSPSPTEPGSARQLALYGVPHDLADESQVRLFAVDEVGNRVELPFLRRFDRHRFPEDDIRLSDSFFEEVVPEILGQTPELKAEATLLDSYLEINRELRATNAATLEELAAQTAPVALWQGAFLQLPSSRVMATFGDRRSYLYGGKKVDEQVHLGYDLASRARAEVPAANHGRVALARYLGIYGNTVVVDHGQGLASLYSHLSEISVQPGQEVEKGQALGRTGATGLAGGDHLHYSILVHGQQVDPIEWWDGNWIRSRILEVIEAGK